VIRPFDGEPANAGNGTMVSLHVADQATVKALYAKVLELGGKDEGGPGPRGDSGFYAAYFRDLDGNKLAAFTLGK
jgi:predicted lactoylglutathione lyase